MYTVEEIRQKIVPIARKHNLKAVYLVGSYAGGEATESSDIDLLFDRTGSDITSLVKASAMYAEIREQFEIPVDLISMTALQRPENQELMINLIRNLERDRVKIYDRCEQSSDDEI